MQQRRRVALGHAEDVTGQELRVCAHEHGLVRIDVAFDEHDVLSVVDVGVVDEDAEVRKWYNGIYPLVVNPKKIIIAEVG